MDIKTTLTALVLISVIVIMASYFKNKEGFDDISKGYFNNLSNNFGNALNTVSDSTSSAPSAPSASSAPPTASVAPSASSAPPTASVAPSALSAPPTASIAPIVPVTSPSTIPTRTDVVPQVSISGSGYDAMSLQQRMDLLKDIQKAVKNEMILNRNTTPVMNTTHNKTTNSTLQGSEYSCHKKTENSCCQNNKNDSQEDSNNSCPPLPDMSQYIKKDAIPCWGCSLDY